MGVQKLIKLCLEKVSKYLLLKKVESTQLFNLASAQQQRRN